MEHSLRCIWPQKPLLEKYLLGLWKMEFTLRNTSLIAAKSRHLEEMDGPSDTGSWAPFHLGPREVKPVSTWVRFAPIHWGKVLFCVLIWDHRRLGEKNKLVPESGQAERLFYVFAKNSCFSKLQGECLLTVTIQKMKNASVWNTHFLFFKFLSFFLAVKTDFIQHYCKRGRRLQN